MVKFWQGNIPAGDSFTCINSSSEKLSEDCLVAVSKRLNQHPPAAPIDNSIRVRQMFGSAEYQETVIMLEQVKEAAGKKYKGYFRQMAAARDAPNHKTC